MLILYYLFLRISICTGVIDEVIINYFITLLFYFYFIRTFAARAYMLSRNFSVSGDDLESIPIKEVYLHLFYSHENIRKVNYCTTHTYHAHAYTLIHAIHSTFRYMILYLKEIYL